MQSSHNKRILTLMFSRLACILPFCTVTYSVTPPTLNTPNIVSNTPYTSNLSSIDNESKLENANAGLMNKTQNHSFNLLMSRYRECYQFMTNNDSNAVLNRNFDVTIYETHDNKCGGDPYTFPRVATYSIDKHGRIFKHNTPNATHDLQYKFNEIPVIVTDLTNFNHPTRSVLNSYEINLQQLEKRANNTFVIFHVSDTPLLHSTDNNSSEFVTTRRQLFDELLVANGGWDFMIVTEDGTEYYIEGSKRKIIDEDSYL